MEAVAHGVPAGSKAQCALQSLVRLGRCSMGANDLVPFDRQEEDFYVPGTFLLLLRRWLHDTALSVEALCVDSLLKNRHSKKRSTGCLCARKIFKGNECVGGCTVQVVIVSVVWLLLRTSEWFDWRPHRRPSHGRSGAKSLHTKRFHIFLCCLLPAPGKHKSAARKPNPMRKSASCGRALRGRVVRGGGIREITGRP